MIDDLGKGSSSYDASHPPVAVFDWDDTMMKNDIGNATLFYMLRHDAVLQPPDRDWSRTNKHLTAAGRAALGGACDSIAEPGQPLPTSHSPRCADTVFTIYDRDVTPEGASAFDGDSDMIHQSYAWGVQLQAGHTPDEVRDFARHAYAENANAPLGATQTVGTSTNVTAWVRIYDAMRDLVRALRQTGFDVWVVSASSQWLVEVVGAEVGVDASHVVGVRALMSPNGKLDYRITGCGTEPDGADTVMTYKQGKRCWINRAIFHLPTQEQLARATDPRMRPVFAAGDSDTDLWMVQDATVLKLVINRNRPALMCNAYSNAHDRWLIQPMFIESFPQHAEPYRCSGLLDEDGQPMNDQPDTIFALQR
jgi:haloacid dehalogenase-like hydrolase